MSMPLLPGPSGLPVEAEYHRQRLIDEAQQLRCARAARAARPRRVRLARILRIR